ncbi:MAG: sigma-70 family RNA polymerase sigma factor [Verrucomicrobia bacterium]|nr:sigma-70 family RNA polymerase sigma factor [Verrucomicrobiota bacterium]
MVIEAGRAATPAAQAALERLCRAYWYPLYAYVRRRGYSAEDAQDLTQGCFESLLRRNDLAEVTPEKGRFRSFLIAALGHYVANEWRRSQRQKRGGGQPVISFAALPAEERYLLEPAARETPDRLYDRRWALTVMDQAIARLDGDYARTGKTEVFELLKPFLTGGRGEKSRAEVAAGLGISVGAVDVALHRLRRRYGEIIREIIAETVARPEDVDEEIRHLMAVLGE